MLSLLTNTAAATALRNLGSTQASLAQTQGQVSSGLRVADASDNAVYWSIGVAMKSQVGTLSSVNAGLVLNKALFDVTSAGINEILDALNAIKQDVIAAASPGTDRNAIQQDIAANQARMRGAAQDSSFNGLNLLDNPSGVSMYANEQEARTDGSFMSGTGTDHYAVTDIYGNTTDFEDTYTYQDHQAQNGDYTSVSPLPPNDPYAYLNTPSTYTDKGLSIASLDVIGVNMNNIFNQDNTSTVPASMGVLRVVTSTNHTTTVDNNPVPNSVHVATTVTRSDSYFNEALNPTREEKYQFYQMDRQAYGTAAQLHTTTGKYKAYVYPGGVSYSDSYGQYKDGSYVSEVIDARDPDGTDVVNPLMNIMNLNIKDFRTLNYDGTPSAAGDYSLTTSDFDAISTMVDNDLNYTKSAQTTIAGYSNLVSSQIAFNGALADAITAGVGSLVDADMNLASTRLQALQAQQQLSVQSLSIANQNSQLILKFFQWSNLHLSNPDRNLLNNFDIT